MTVKGRPAAVVDVSYGGLRLEMSGATPLPGSFDVEVAGIGLHLEVQPVWSQSVDGARHAVCGADAGRRAHAVGAHLARDRRPPERVSRFGYSSLASMLR